MFRYVESTMLMSLRPEDEAPMLCMLESAAKEAQAKFFVVAGGIHESVSPHQFSINVETVLRKAVTVEKAWVTVVIHPTPTKHALHSMECMNTVVDSERIFIS